jgi:RNA polymerase sigma-70 factor (ECF subfamily)
MGVRSKARAALTAADRAVIDALVADVGPRLLAYVRRMYGDRLQDSEDIVAETFCRAASNIEALRASDRRDLYLLTIARNLSQDGFRRQRPRPVSNGRPDDQAGRGLNPAEALGRGEQVQALRDAVSHLPEDLREVVVLRLSGGLKFEEIADLLRIPLGTALSRMHAAVQRLREMLGCWNER